jgi:rRNA maturation protein Nop10
MDQGRSIKFLSKKIEARLKRIARCGTFVAGSLNRIEKKGKSGKVSVSYLLTFKEEGKTTSVYVPKAFVPEVKQWVKQHRELKRLMTEISHLSIGVIRRYVPEKRAGRREKEK